MRILKEDIIVIKSGIPYLKRIKKDGVSTEYKLVRAYLPSEVRRGEHMENDHLFFDDHQLITTQLASQPFPRGGLQIWKKV
ncbi:hypothetical protein COU24_03880 [Candidatus Kuenenbacteria bacterium CG10_big_fil_rev_8_21_14_0_10_39_14]|uniref:Uncharacterized protein n=1 Tax=Candidatus Kuenenbacteria bacterium CG10_big_fil_rev_8_21_14_0_10_39_14 TaxID=1974619 RepID=A0A2H0U4Z8_9BACT|nr:MAG: hypothetical protein COU24_03880 [Candidatus Kuenenbacteria bacterium CG10_big_fil_rev_8_21_14_0_10_39_14]